LNERQKKAVGYIKEKRTLTNKDYQIINNVHRNTATNDLAELVKKGIIKRMGRGRGAKYVLL